MVSGCPCAHLLRNPGTHPARITSPEHHAVRISPRGRAGNGQPMGRHPGVQMLIQISLEPSGLTLCGPGWRVMGVGIRAGSMMFRR
ncbi:hypothetical protein FRAHR75_1470011 [Frankia sp. Hr75.2]|nr:hypothetical protein FRAHR75_1470011 [Frankia sp. Hr75.2]